MLPRWLSLEVWRSPWRVTYRKSTAIHRWCEIKLDFLLHFSNTHSPISFRQVGIYFGCRFFVSCVYLTFSDQRKRNLLNTNWPCCRKVISSQRVWEIPFFVLLICVVFVSCMKYFFLLTLLDSLSTCSLAQLFFSPRGMKVFSFVLVEAWIISSLHRFHHFWVPTVKGC